MEDKKTTQQEPSTDTPKKKLHTDFTINKGGKSKRDFSLWPILVVALIAALIGAYPMRYAIYKHQFTSFMTDFRESFINADKFYELTGEYQGKTFTMDQREGSYIFTEFNMIGMGTKCGVEEMEDPFTIYFGDGSSILIGTSTMEGRSKRIVDCVYLEYTYPSGKKYCYKTDWTEFHYLLDPIINYHLGSEEN